MAAVSIVIVIAFGTILAIKEIPQMLKEQHYKELWVFSILLGIGVAANILVSLKIKMPNPSDFVAWIYSPFKGIMESLTK